MLIILSQYSLAKYQLIIHKKYAMYNTVFKDSISQVILCESYLINKQNNTLIS